MSCMLPTLTLALLVATGLAAPVAAAPAEASPFADLLFAPELIIKHQSAIGLSAEQRRTLIAEVTGAQADFLPDQMELAGMAEELTRLLGAPRVDEQAALEAAARAMELESRIKRRHLRLAIRIKNLLDEGQQAKLQEFRGSG